MDAIDILGGLLGGGRSTGSGSGGGLGGKILKDLINAGTRGSAPAQQPRQTQVPDSRAPSHRPTSLDERARELEDLLGVAHGRSAGQGQPPARQPQMPPAAQPRFQPPPPSRPRDQDPPVARQPGAFPSEVSPSEIGTRTSPGGARDFPLTQNDEALVLVRAMINAAKSDGSISQEEQQAIIERIANPTQETIDFLRQEFNAPLNVRDFAWSVPLGMEQQVYTMSLASINLDTNPEADYLRDLAHGLRLDAQFCNDLHQRYGAPSIF